MNIILALLLLLFIVYYAVPKEIVQTQKKAHSIILSCMDFRFIDSIHTLLRQYDYNENYNHVVLAGSSLGYNQNKYTEWTKTIDAHIQLAIKLHDIKEIIVIDHMDCGAYRLLYDNPTMEPIVENNLHIYNLKKIKNIFKQKYPQLNIKTFLLDGTSYIKLIE